MKSLIITSSAFLFFSVSAFAQTQPVILENRAASKEELSEFCEVASQLYRGSNDYSVISCSEQIGMFSRNSESQIVVTGFLRGMHKQGHEYILKCTLKTSELKCEVQI